MEILNSYVYLPMNGGAILSLSIFIGIVAGCITLIATENGIKITIAAILTAVICGGLLTFGNIKCSETHYKGYITNWEEYCKQYDTISVEGKLVTAKLKETQE